MIISIEYRSHPLKFQAFFRALTAKHQSNGFHSHTRASTQKAHNTKPKPQKAVPAPRKTTKKISKVAGVRKTINVFSVKANKRVSSSTKNPTTKQTQPAKAPHAPQPSPMKPTSKPKKVVVVKSEKITT